MPTLDEMRKIAKARTKGNWVINNAGNVFTWNIWNKDNWDGFVEAKHDPDIGFIAMAANHFDKLLDVVEAAVALDKGMEDSCENWSWGSEIYWTTSHALKKALAALEQDEK